MALFDDKNSDLILEIKAHSTTYKHTYRIGDKNQILNFFLKILSLNLILNDLGNVKPPEF